VGLSATVSQTNYFMWDKVLNESADLGPPIARKLQGRSYAPGAAYSDSREQELEIEPSTRRPLTMAWLRRVFRLPARESIIGFVLVLCVVSMSCMSIALVWQAQIIASQREAIQWLEKLKFGG
jgi:hypothetical protein